MKPASIFLAATRISEFGAKLNTISPFDEIPRHAVRYIPFAQTLLSDVSKHYVGDRSELWL